MTDLEESVPFDAPKPNRYCHACCAVYHTGRAPCIHCRGHKLVRLFKLGQWVLCPYCCGIGSLLLVACPYCGQPVNRSSATHLPPSDETEKPEWQ